MSPEIAEAQSEIWAAEQDLKEDARLLEQKMRIELTPAEMLRRHPLTVLAMVSFTAYLVYRAVSHGKHRADDAEFAQKE